MDQATDLDRFQAVRRRPGHAVGQHPRRRPLGPGLVHRRLGHPKLSAGAQARFAARIRDDLVAALLFENRVALLDGSDPGRRLA